MIVRILFLLIADLLSAVYVFGSGHGESSPGTDVTGRLNVVASTSIIGDVVANIGGDAINLSVLIGVGQDPHSFEPTPATLASVESAQVIFTNGFGLEQNLIDIINATAKGVIEEVSKGIKPRGAEESDHDHGAFDPHVWFDPTKVLIWVDNIENALVKADPPNQSGYHSRAERYRQSLTELDSYIRSQTSSIPEKDKTLVTDHEVLGYFADEYGFKLIGTILPGVSAAADASTRHMSDLVDLLRKEGVSVIFIGSTAGNGVEKLAETLAGELKNEVKIVTLLTGSLSQQGEPGDSYINYMKYDADRIAGALR